jgi:hypothetical protein
MNSKKSLVPHAKETWKYTTYICIGDRKESTWYSLVILILNAESM